MSVKAKTAVTTEQKDRFKVVASAPAGEVAPVRQPKPPAKAKPARVLDAAVDKAIRSSRRQTRRLIIFSLLLVVGLPSALGITYFGLIASDQYSAEARFAVRGAETTSVDVMGMLTGGGSAAANPGDSYILQEFIGSRELVDRLDATVHVRERYDHPAADWWSRFSSTAPIESFVSYWRDMASAEYDAYSGIITLQVRAFTPEDAVVIANAVVAESDRLVNDLSESARLDAVAFAQRELHFAEERLREARTATAAYRGETGSIDPTAVAAAHEQLIAQLESQLSAAQAQLSQTIALAGPDSPAVRAVTAQITSIQEQIAARRASVGASTSATTGDDIGLSGELQAFEALATEQEFAQQAYVSARASLEGARAEAQRTQRYLATFVTPSVPEAATHPLRLINSMLIVVLSLVAWGIMALLYAAVRDHMV